MPIWKGIFTSTYYAASNVNGTVEMIIPENLSGEGNGFITYLGAYYNNTRSSLGFTIEGEEITGNMNGSQVNFKILKHEDSAITGTYSLLSPFDSGKFEIFLTDDIEIDNNTRQSGCVIS